MYKVYQVMPVPKWTIDNGRVVGPTGQPLDNVKAPYVPTMDAMVYLSKHGREQIPIPQSDEMVVVNTGAWTSLPVKGGPIFVQLLMKQNLDFQNPTLQRFAFRKVDVADTEEEMRALLDGVPEFDMFGRQKVPALPATTTQEPAQPSAE